MAFNKAKLLQEAERLVSQGKLALAIKHFQAIVDKDPSDISLRNTIGDLYVREKNVPEALNQFRHLADSYTQEGFTVKAIAIYKKISKLEPNSVEVQLKLAELYQVQGLGREARDQYSQAFEYYKKKNYPDRAVEVLQRMVQLEPENPSATARLAMYCEQLGRKEDAAKAYMLTAELANVRNDASTADASLKKASELDPHNQQIVFLRARNALRSQHYQDAIHLLSSAPALSDKPEVKKLFLDAYSALGELKGARKYLMEVYEANPSDFTPITSYVTLCCSQKDYDAAFEPLSEVSGALVSARNTVPLMEALKLIWAKTSNHLPTLELILQVAEKTGDAYTVPEALEALGHVYFREGQLDKAEICFRRLCERETENENYRDLLKQVMQKAGKEYSLTSPLALGAAEIPLEPDQTEGAHQAVPGAPAPAPPVDADDKKRLKDVLANVDLFSQYGLQERAIDELEKALEEFPSAIDLYKRLIDICLTSQPLRAGRAAVRLTRIYKERGDTESMARFEKLARKCFGGTIPPELAVETAEAPPPPAVAEAAASLQPTLTPPAEPPAEPAVSPQEIPLERSTREAAAPAPQPPETPPPAVEAAPALEKAPEPAAAEPATPPAAVAEAPSAELNYQEVHEQINYYLSQGFVDEATKAISELELKYPGDERLTLLRRIVDASIWVPLRRPAPPPPPEPPKPVLPEEIDLSEDLSTLGPATPPEATPVPSPEPQDSTLEAPAAAVSESRAEPLPVVGEPDSSIVQPPRAQTAEPPGEEIDLTEELPSFEPPRQPFPPPAEDWELPTSFAIPETPPAPRESGEPPAAEAAPLAEVPGIAPVEAAAREMPMEASMPETPPQAPTTEAAPSAPPEAPAPAGSPPSSQSLPGDMASDLASPLGGLQTAPAVTAEESISPFHDLLAEFREPGGARSAQDESETHYSLGVAFREMNLLEEAIGEFQKVVRGAKPGAFPANYLQACSLLAICFMDKKMPAIAAKWYLRALDFPDLDEEGALALQYDLGIAYEQAGDTQKALERLTEVYSQNIDFRDVAEKIKRLQQKV
jgi:tetratricopeptide (TPR) repeat protein